MSEIDRLISEYCPDGVDFKALGDVGTFTRGNGLQKKDFVDEGVGCIHYGQIYTYYGTSTTTTKSFVTPELAARLKKADPCDLVVTTTSENLEDVCTAVAWLGDGQIAVGGHSCVFKHGLDPMYAAYYFRTEQFEIQKRKFVSGTKVKEIKPSDIARIRIPVPDLPIQRKIADVLGKLESLQIELKAELKAELNARGRQYDHYRDQLLTFSDSPGVKWTTLGEIYDSSSGLSKSADQFGSGDPFLAYKDVFHNPVVPDELSGLVKTTEAEQDRYSIRAGDVFVTRTSEDLKGLGMSCAALRDHPRATFNGFSKRLRPKEMGVVEPAYAAYFFRSSLFRAQIARTAVLSTRVSLNDAILMRIRIAVPGVEDQRRIVRTLDNFDALKKDLSACLPAEIEARRKQYEYYRDKLLTFEERVA